jgi:hypothetical protein
MTTLAQDIKALIDLGHTLERATELATQDRAISTGKIATTLPASLMSNVHFLWLDFSWISYHRGTSIACF